MRIEMLIKEDFRLRFIENMLTYLGQYTEQGVIIKRIKNIRRENYVRVLFRFLMCHDRTCSV